MLPSSGPTRTFVLSKHNITPVLTSDLPQENIQTIGPKEGAFVLERGKFSSMCSVQRAAGRYTCHSKKCVTYNTLNGNVVTTVT